MLEAVCKLLTALVLVFSCITVKADVHERSLSQTPEPAASVVKVSTIDEFKDAVKRGDPHIEVVDHLDFRGVKPVITIVGTDTLMVPTIHESVRSIRGHCAQPPPDVAALDLVGPPLLPQKPNQCLFLFERWALMVYNNRASKLWLDNFYMRHEDFNTSSTNTGMLSVRQVDPTSVAKRDFETTPAVWMTNMTMQANGVWHESPVAGLFVTARAYAEDCEFSNLGYNTGTPDNGWGASGIAFSPITVGLTPATLSLNRCTFEDVYTPDNVVVGIGHLDGPNSVRLQECTFRNNTVKSSVGRLGPSQVFSDEASAQEVWGLDTNTTSAPKPLNEVSGFQFLSASDGAYLAIREEVYKAGGSNAPAPPPPPGNQQTAAPDGPAGSATEGGAAAGSRAAGTSGGSDSGGLKTTAIIGIAAAIAIVVLIAAVVGFLLFKRNRKRARKQKAGQTANAAAAGGAYVAPGTAPHNGQGGPPAAAPAWGAAPPLPQGKLPIAPAPQFGGPPPWGHQPPFPGAPPQWGGPPPGHAHGYGFPPQRGPGMPPQPPQPPMYGQMAAGAQTPQWPSDAPSLGAGSAYGSDTYVSAHAKPPGPAL